MAVPFCQAFGQGPKAILRRPFQRFVRCRVRSNRKPRNQQLSFHSCPSRFRALGLKVHLQCMTVGRALKTAREFNQWQRRTDQRRDTHDSIDQPRYRWLKRTTHRKTANDRPILAEKLVGRPLDCYSLWSHAKLQVLPTWLQETKCLLYHCGYPRGIYDDGETI
jgi:hypothetical protein